MRPVTCCGKDAEEIDAEILGAKKCIEAGIEVFNAKVQAAKERRLTASLGPMREKPAVSAPRNHWPGRAPRPAATRAAARAVLIAANAAGASAANAANVDRARNRRVRGTLEHAGPSIPAEVVALSNGPLRMEHSPLSPEGLL